MEDRIVPAPWIVNATGDAGVGNAQQQTGDLRFCVANAASGSQIYFDPSLKGQTINLGNQIQVSQNGLDIIGTDINGNNLNLTVSGQTKTRLFEIIGNSSIQNLTLTGGNGSGGNGGAVLVDSGGNFTADYDQFLVNKSSGNGGALENDGITNVKGCNFLTNTASGSGGALENTSELTVYASPVEAPCSFTSNTATASGGAIDSCGNGLGSLGVSYSQFLSNVSGFGGAIATNDSASLTQDTFGAQNQANSAGMGSGGGGAIYAVAPASGAVSLELTSCQLLYNTAAFGGAIYTSTGHTDVEKSTFTNNSSPINGGAIYSQIVNPTTNNCTLTLNLDYFKGNSSVVGGAVESYVRLSTGMYPPIQTVVTNCTFDSNKAANNTGDKSSDYGGGLYIVAKTNGPGTTTRTTLTNDTFFNNTTDGHGGALVLSFTDAMGQAQSTAALTSDTFYQNMAGIDGGAIYVNTALQGVMSLLNTILSGNDVTPINSDGVDIAFINRNTQAMSDLGYNLVGTNNLGFDALNTTDWFADDPRLNGLAQNGAPQGYPPTLAPITTGPQISKAYENGKPTLAGTTDERGFTRQAGKVSIGAEDPDAM